MITKLTACRGFRMDSVSQAGLTRLACQRTKNIEQKENIMRLATLVITAAAIAVFAAAASAGSLAPNVMEAPVAVVETAPAGSSVPNTWIIAGVLTALVAAAASQ